MEVLEEKRQTTPSFQTPYPTQPWLQNGMVMMNSNQKYPAKELRDMSAEKNIEPITEQPSAVILSARFGPRPQKFMCSICLNKITTKVYYVNGVATWLGCAGIFLIGGVLGCCLIPFYVDSCKDVQHYCPICNTYFDTYKRI
ncbi:unnamed protein product [Calicophoron daubneyi]|uniref:LITAF domain-containing protein n=1 Tax=Calicophoron daubneyi TaxID=300641 RepID=A0AAV2TUG4_CALDB